MSTLASHNLAPATGTTPALLAWAGWQLRVPADWRPLKLMGTADKGWMMVGDAMCAFFSIHWEQQKRRGISDGEAWARGRLKRLGLLPDPSPPAQERFSACAWAHGVQSEEDKQTTHWFGYAARSNLLLGLKVNGVLPEPERALITREVLPTLRTSPADGQTTWSIYDLSFVTPPGFKLAKRHLFSGDVAMEFRKGRRESLLLRQVYPGDLALSRRDFEEWLASYPFIEHRRLRKSTLATEQWGHASRPELSGLRRTGRKRLGFPLGAFGPRWTHALAVHDKVLDRVLIAEHMACVPPDGKACEEAILGMNRPVREELRDG